MDLNKRENLEVGSCSVCHREVLAEYYFCPNCGNSLREKPEEITAIKQIGWYAFAIFLPPLGFWPGIKYLTKKDPESKKFGGIIIALTLVSTVFTTWSIFKMIGSYLEMLNSVLY